MKSLLIAMAAGAVLAACSPRVPTVDLDEVPPQQRQQSLAVKTYTLGVEHPAIAEHLGDVEAWDCKFYEWNPPASKGAALSALKVEAVKLGGDAIIDITFQQAGHDIWGANCIESVQARGIAVKLAPQN